MVSGWNQVLSSTMQCTAEKYRGGFVSDTHIADMKHPLGTGILVPF